MRILDGICGHEDLQRLDEKGRLQLCTEIRQSLIDHVSGTGGHVASNLGVVELTVALETVYDSNIDRLILDVGHQSYIHKILTGREEQMATLRQFGGIAGFPKPSESDTDAFVAGHASSSVSVALGMARARTLLGQSYDVVAVIGDGAATGGMAYEGLNDAAVSKEPLVVVLNDNALSIDRNVGGMASHLRKLRTKDRYLGMKQHYRYFMSKIPGGGTVYRLTHKMKDWFRRVLIPTTIFDNMGFTYLGPVDGHDTENLIALLRQAKAMRRPVLVHVVTKKGKGYRPAEEHPKLFHAVGKFDAATGEVQKKTKQTFSDMFGATMLQLAAGDPRVCAITAAMPGGTGLLEFKSQYASRLFDVGIAEGHAVSMAGGLAKQGMIPVVALYSTFLQRGYDMILQDVSMLGLHVVFAVDRAGLVGEDGETHHGVFDIGFLRQAPGMQILCPASLAEQQQMLKWAVNVCNGPVAVRYPRGGNRGYEMSAWEKGLRRISVEKTGGTAAILTYGVLQENALAAADLLAEHGVHLAVIRLLQIHPLPIEEILQALATCSHVFIMEETAAGCGIGKELAHALVQRNSNRHVECFDLGDRFVPHGDLQTLYRYCGLDAETVSKRILEVLSNEK